MQTPRPMDPGASTGGSSRRRRMKFLQRRHMPEKATAGLLPSPPPCGHSTFLIFVVIPTGAALGKDSTRGVRALVSPCRSSRLMAGGQRQQVRPARRAARRAQLIATAPAYARVLGVVIQAGTMNLKGRDRPAGGRSSAGRLGNPFILTQFVASRCSSAAQAELTPTPFECLAERDWSRATWSSTRLGSSSSSSASSAPRSLRRVAATLFSGLGPSRRHGLRRPVVGGAS